MFIELLQFIGLALGLFLKIFGVYFLFISLFALKKQKGFPSCTPKTKFAVVIPARNEEAVIGELIKSLKKQEYPPELFDIYTVPNNCSDNTENTARAAGSKIINCVYPVKCKGDVLKQTFSRLTQKPYNYDAFCVFDADNVADRHFLSEMNNAFCSGAAAAKGRLEAINPYDSWISGCYDIYFNMMSVFFNRARAGLNLSARLVGTGFAVSRSLLEKTGGFNTKTIAEDAEYSSLCALAGERVYWVPGAVSYDEEPNSFKASLVQRKRWISGLMQVGRLMLPPLFHAQSKRNRAQRLDLIIFLLWPFVQALYVIPLLISILTSVLSGIPDLIGFLASSIIGVAVSYTGTVLLAWAVSLLSGRRGVRMFKSVLTYPLFVFSWLPLQFISLFVKTKKWEEIRHSRNVSPETADR